jgi:DNA-binding response OmpR family regulator
MTKILVLDDDQVILDLLQTVLDDAGYEIFLASSLSQVPEGTSVDVVITDLIPLKEYRRETAAEWVASLRSRFLRSPLVIVTAHADALTEADKLGADAIVAKPFDVDVLLAKLEELLA